MTLIVVDQGEVHMLTQILDVDMTLRLFANDVTHGLTPEQIEQLTEADFTEADFTGYSPAALEGGTWSITPGDPATGSHDAHQFQSTADQSPQTIYGYWLTRDSDDALVWFEPVPPVVVEFDEDLIVVQPRITLRDEQDAT